MTTWPLDTREVYWAMERAVALVELLERAGTGGRPSPSPSRRPDAPAPAPATGGDADGADPQASPGGTTDVDVTVHCDDAPADREHDLATSRPPSGRPRPRRRRRRRRLRRQRADRDEHALVAHRHLVLVGQHGLGAGVGEAHVDLVLELGGDLGLDVGGDRRPRRRRSRRRRAARRGRPAAARSATTSRIVATYTWASRDISSCADPSQPADPRGPRTTANTAHDLTPARLVARSRLDLGPVARRGLERHGGAVRRAMICSTDPYGQPSGRSVGRAGRLVTVSRRSPHWISPSSSRAASMMPSSVCRRSTSRCRSALTDLQLVALLVEPGQLVVLAEPRAHGQAEQGGADGAGDDEADDAEQDRRACGWGRSAAPWRSAA